MIRTTPSTPADAREREDLRRQLLRLIVKNEALRRDEKKSVSK